MDAMPLQDVIERLLALARAEDKGVRLRTCQLLQLIINNQVQRIVPITSFKRSLRNSIARTRISLKRLPSHCK